MATMTPSTRTHNNRQTFSCRRCAERKVKCDRQNPCAACIKHNSDCVFSPVQLPKKRTKRVKVNVLTDRLRQYEALLQEQGIDPGKLPGRKVDDSQSQSVMPIMHDQQEKHGLQIPTPSSPESDPSSHSVQTSTVRGQAPFRFVENTLWNRVVEEVSGSLMQYQLAAFSHSYRC
jgi:hypothetical protein